MVKLRVGGGTHNAKCSNVKNKRIFGVIYQNHYEKAKTMTSTKADRRMPHDTVLEPG